MNPTNPTQPELGPWGSNPTQNWVQIGFIRVYRVEPEFEPYVRPTRPDWTCFFTLRANPTEPEFWVQNWVQGEKMGRVWLHYFDPKINPINCFRKSTSIMTSPFIDCNRCTFLTICAALNSILPVNFVDQLPPTQPVQCSSADCMPFAVRVLLPVIYLKASNWQYIY